MLFAENAGLVAHSQGHLQRLNDCFAQTFHDYSLPISPTITKVMGQGTIPSLSITISKYNLEAINNFTYLGSRISKTISLVIQAHTEYGTTVS